MASEVVTREVLIRSGPRSSAGGAVLHDLVRFTDLLSSTVAAMPCSRLQP